MKSRVQSGFTLIELLVGIVVIAVLAGLIVTGVQAAKTKAMQIKDISQLRSIGTAALARAQDNYGLLYSKDEIGNSSYRAYDDPMSLCQILAPYMESPDTWVSPKPHPRTLSYNNSYAWSRSTNVTDKPLVSIPSLKGTVLLWNNATFIEVTPKGRVAGGSGGPPNASKEYQVKPWKNGKAQNWLYADLHVETF